MKAFFYVQHLLGIGHLKRAATISQALRAAGFEVTLASGGAPVEGIPVLQLPPAASDPSFLNLLDEAGPLDESLHYAMDYDLWLKIGARFGARHVDAVWSLQRFHAAAKTKAHEEDFWPERLGISRRYGGRLVSPLLIRRYVRQPLAQRVAIKAAAAAYALAGKRPR